MNIIPEAIQNTIENKNLYALSFDNFGQYCSILSLLYNWDIVLEYASTRVCELIPANTRI